jgi:hypothetical protein
MPPCPDGAPTPNAFLAGLICTKCSPHQVAHDAIYDSRSICMRQYGAAPDVHVYGDPNFTFAYVPSHLHHMVFELVKVRGADPARSWLPAIGFAMVRRVSSGFGCRCTYRASPSSHSHSSHRICTAWGSQGQGRAFRILLWMCRVLRGHARVLSISGRMLLP